MVGQGKFPSKKIFEKKPERMRYEVRIFQATIAWLVYSPEQQVCQCSWNTVSKRESECPFREEVRSGEAGKVVEVL